MTGRDASIELSPPGGFTLKHGGVLPTVRMALTFYGRDFDRAPTILACHALTGSSRVDAWWPDVLGPGRLLDTDRYCIACANVLGGCYGSTGPGPSSADAIGLGEEFPVVTVEDMVRAEHDALVAAGVRHISAVIGGSLGGQQALQWGAAYPDFVDGVVAIGATGRLSPMGIGLNAIGREAIRLDPVAGLRVARMLAMLSYKSASLLWRRHERRRDRGGADPGASLSGRFDVEGYLQHQGDKLAARMDPRSYVYLTKAMDLFDLEVAGWRVPALLVAIESDWLYPPDEVEATARALGADARTVRFRTDHGHDGFLADAPQLTSIVRPFLEDRCGKVDGLGRASASH
ncbi:MAG TPA: homoserine O-acetyltransferase [Candidatus Eremiobacteraceae bacterium]|nr:homoserine O-acetyltransferase [Candidatus Eremiobacteraceae bacterium]